ncbi:MAG: nitrous oxide-stimulated promoter family protein [Actinomycetia bacterium]|nr:nitrous oxide-stimulated promoter family protein [Actinomycetes bacterium]
MHETETIIELEKITVTKMIELYCAHLHSPNGGPPCKQCSKLITYVHLKLDHCLFGNDKPTCNNCTMHCYQPQMRSRIKLIMRYSGPRMLYCYPVLAIKHLMRQHHG